MVTSLNSQQTTKKWITKQTEASYRLIERFETS